MERREFLRRLTRGLAAAWAMGWLARPARAGAGASELRLALLADAHLKDGNELRPEAMALARAVSEIQALRPPPDLVLFAGDLAHRGRPDALDLGREILSDLPAPLLAVRGEGDGASWMCRFGEPRFSHPGRGFHLLGLDTALRHSSRRRTFELGVEQRRWLAAELARVDPASPLIIISHAPLTSVFRPWRQWTGDAAHLAPLWSRFTRVICLHGHVHASGGRDQGLGVSYQIPPDPPLGKGGMAAAPPWFKGGMEESPPFFKGDLGGFARLVQGCNNDSLGQIFAANRQLKTENRFIHQGLPATAWPLPSPCLGTPARLRPGLGTWGCGWSLAAIRDGVWQISPHLWRA